MNLIVFIVEALIFSAVALMALGVLREVDRILAQRRRLAGHGEMRREMQGETVLADSGRDSAFFRWIAASTSISDPRERQKLQQALMLAGIDSPNAPVWYVIGRFSLAVLLPVLFL